MKIKMVIECELKEAALIEEVLMGTAAMINILDSVPVAPKPKSRFFNGMKRKPKSARKYILELFAKHGSPLTQIELKRHAAAGLFAEMSLIAMANKLVVDKVLERRDDGNYYYE